MNAPFVMMPMCDCHIDEKTNKKSCVPFLRAFEYTCDGIRAIGDYGYDGKPYAAEGEISSEAKCCDCCDDKMADHEVCYDLACLLRAQERNGGLENISIMGGDGVAGATLHFNPPLNSAQNVANALNAVNYLGFSTWHNDANKAGFLCVSVPDGVQIPGPASGLRFRRFRTTTQNNGAAMAVSHPNYGTYSTTQDSLSAGSGASQSTLVSSNIHYLCKLAATRQDYITSSTTQFVLAEPFVASQLQNANVYRIEFPDNSTALYVANYPVATTFANAWSGTQNPTNVAGRNVWAINLEKWSDYVLSASLIYGSTKSYCQLDLTAITTNSNVTIYPGTLVVDVPCNILLSSMYNLQINSMEVSSTGSISLANTTGHIKVFAEDVGVGNYLSHPYVDGAGGSISWANDCSIVGPFDVGHWGNGNNPN
jgi:hypothetical protein